MLLTIETGIKWNNNKQSIVIAVQCANSSNNVNCVFSLETTRHAGVVQHSYKSNLKPIKPTINPGLYPINCQTTLMD